MSRVVEVSSPMNVHQLDVRIRDAAVVQFSQPLAEAEYRSLGALLTDHPTVTLRAYGFDEELATLRFLRWFPRLRRFSVAGLHNLTELAPLHQLDADVECLDIGETHKPLNLAPVTAFHGLHQLRIVAHRRGLPELLNANPGLQGLALWRVPVDQVLPVIALPDLQSLALTLGSLARGEWLTQVPTLRYLALRAVRNLTDLNAVTRLPALQWLWLDALTLDRLPDFGSSSTLLRADCTQMRHLRHPASLQGLAAAPQLRELLVTESRLPVDAFVPFAGHPTLEHVGFGLGSERRNRDAKRLLRRTPPSNHAHFAATHGLLRML
ncbi:hypothetical protein DLE60_08200 [Micromonospora globispora]|uniref:Leucine-rich repeat domain-containing protein n=1 Tax=Micromonospora globispora TaxID=1450148 RepID=A0A317JW14_9ACTN|nr:hypothetical protein [Micromonospora globispora]PWU44875.1 hypothetical protein DLJ46_23685 [Micromonospora globispora]PWU60991.1 hypothetical protein DLE60_08200 [Micromonospora globispora]RQW88153.1 hypothetical protein DKL51_25040 [Micromonospora globispora]